MTVIGTLISERYRLDEKIGSKARYTLDMPPDPIFSSRR